MHAWLHGLSSVDESSLFISLTLLSGVTVSDSVMQEEIFGPLLPFVTVESIDKAIEFVRERCVCVYIRNKARQI